jgi:hypothetical protein
MKVILATGAAVLLVGTSIAIAQQPPQPPRPYYVGNPVGLPIAPPAPGADAAAFAAVSDHVKVYGALVSVESCSYDPGRDLIVAPNRGVGQAIRTNDAFVAFINHDGSVHTPRWIGVQNPGEQRDNMDPPLILNEPLGSAIKNDVLYLSDRDGGNPDPANAGQNVAQVAVVRKFSMADGRPMGELRVPESTAFNDLAVAEDGTVYATNTGAGGQTPDPTTWRVFKIMPDGTATVLIEGEPLRQPNGIEIDNDGNLVVVNIGNDDVNVFKPDGGHVTTLKAAQPGNDGLVIMPDGTIFVSSVQRGGVSMIRPGEEAVLIAENIPSAASMCYDKGANQLVIPMNPNNGLAFVPLEGVWAP